MALPDPRTLECATGSATVFDYGAHVTTWAPAGTEPVLWLSARARYQPGVAIRGGVPIVLPWFGAGRSGTLEPAHGFARTSFWKHASSTIGPDAVVARFTLENAGSAEFPHHLRADFTVQVGATLDLALRVENADVGPLSFEEALHAYLHVGDIRQVTVKGLDGCSYIDQVAGCREFVQEGDLRLTGETDRIYTCAGQVRVIDPVLARVLVIDKTSSSSTVAWNPWVDKARDLQDMGDDEWLHMLCIEGGNLRASSVYLEPGEKHLMRYSLRVEPLD